MPLIQTERGFFMGNSGFVSIAKWMTDIQRFLAPREALALQQVLSWMEYNAYSGKNFIDGRYWVFNTYEEWNKYFPGWGEKTVRLALKGLEEKGVLVTGNYNKERRDRTKWYSIDFDALDRLSPVTASLNFTSRNASGSEDGNGEGPHLVKTTRCNQGHPVKTTRALPYQDIYIDKEKSIKGASTSVCTSSRAFTGGKVPEEKGILFSYKPGNSDQKELLLPTRKLVAAFGEEWARFGMEFVSKYTNEWYPSRTGHPHCSIMRGRRAECAWEILQCMGTLDIDEDGITEACTSAVRFANCDPTIFYATTPTVMGYWLVNSGETSFYDLIGTIYQPCEVQYR